ncbi:angiotensin-converting enzyme-like [Periplaneta americana]|uniref:angiotensin-converting enzyme-like n=1 Tax=Periplaneta americana TaxID=6978 RepID=UPI0037E73F07
MEDAILEHTDTLHHCSIMGTSEEQSHFLLHHLELYILPWQLFILVSTASVMAVSALVLETETQDEEEKARAYLKYLDKEYTKYGNKVELARWKYATQITEENLKTMLLSTKDVADFAKRQWEETIKYPWRTFKDPDIRRQFKIHSFLGPAVLDKEKLEKLNLLASSMISIYSTAKICDYKDRNKCNLSLQPELEEIMTSSRDADELKYIWVEWRKMSGEKCREMFNEYVAISNEAATLNNFTDNAEYWLKNYESPDFREQLSRLWNQLQPLYLQIHAYVRRKLRETYGEDIVTRRGPIPAHLLGNMWAQMWGSILNISTPYPGKATVDVTSAMVKQGYTPLKMFKMAEEFFISLNMSAMPASFWKNSILEKPKDRDLICQASAVDLHDGKDFRIIQCTRITMDDLFSTHHEMGHVQYFIEYNHQPSAYRDGANPGFHEAVGDVIALSVLTPKHLREIGLLEEESKEEDYESTINYLFLQGLQKIVFLPYAYITDLWRWDVFKGRITKENYNCEWWKLREKYQGLEPPVDRTEEDFDPASKFHIVASVPYIRYFVSFVIQFQFHKALCAKAGQFDPNDPKKPLHECDIYRSTDAGNLLRKMLRMGSSKPWPDAMELLTGQREMDASGMLDYFKPLSEWLEKENNKTGEYIGWEHTKKRCVKTRNELQN